MASTSTTDQFRRVPPRRIESDDSDGSSASPPALTAAATVVIAAVLAVVALSTEISTDRGEPTGGGVAAAGIVAIAPLVLVAVAAALGLVVSRTALVGALTAGFGAVSAGLAVLDVGLLLDPIDANRLELVRPVTAAALEPGTGAYLLFAAHVLGALGGLFGLITVSRAALRDGYGYSHSADMTDRATTVRIGGWLSLVAGVAAVVTAVSMFARPYESTDSIVLVRAVIESPLTTAVGSGMTALAVLVVVAAALASVSPTVAAGALAGAGLGTLGLAGSRVVAGASSGSSIGVSPGATTGAVASIVLVLVAILIVPVAALRARRAGGADVRRTDAVNADGSIMVWHVVAGVAGVVAGVLLGAGAVLPVLDVPDQLPTPTILATRVAIVAGFVLVLASVPMFFSLLAAPVRPALGILSVAAVMTATSVLQSVVLATDIDGISLGAGGFATVAALLASVVCGVAVLFAGSAERDDVDTSASGYLDRPTAVVGITGAVLAAAGLALPLYRGTDVTAAWLGELPWGWDAWGQAMYAVTVIVGAVVAARSRPARGTALLVGAVVGMALYLSAWPLTRMRAVDPTVGSGVVLAAVGVVVLGVAALLSARRRVR